jgi:hypothetical protein
MSSPPGKIVVVQVSSGASCNASLPSTRRKKPLVNRDKNRDFCFLPDALSQSPFFWDWRDAEGNVGVTEAVLCEIQ